MRDGTEQLLLASKAKPVTDGLFLWVDGRDEYGQNHTMLNRATGNYALYWYSWSIPTPTVDFSSANGFYTVNFSLVDNNGGDIMIYPSTLGANAQTIEMLTVSHVDGFVIPGAGGFWARIGIRRDFVRYAWGIDRYSDITVANAITQPLHIVARPNCLTINGVHYKNLSNFNSVSFDAPLLIRCYKSWNSPTDYAIGTLRAYDRILTDDEVQQNFAYEQKTGRIPQ